MVSTSAMVVWLITRLLHSRCVEIYLAGNSELNFGRFIPSKKNLSRISVLTTILPLSCGSPSLGFSICRTLFFDKSWSGLKYFIASSLITGSFPESRYRAVSPVGIKPLWFKPFTPPNSGNSAPSGKIRDTTLSKYPGTRDGNKAIKQMSSSCLLRFIPRLSLINPVWKSSKAFTIGWVFNSGLLSCISLIRNRIKSSSWFSNSSQVCFEMVNI